MRQYCKKSCGLCGKSSPDSCCNWILSCSWVVYADRYDASRFWEGLDENALHQGKADRKSKRRFLIFFFVLPSISYKLHHVIISSQSFIAFEGQITRTRDESTGVCQARNCLIIILKKMGISLQFSLDEQNIYSGRKPEQNESQHTLESSRLKWPNCVGWCCFVLFLAAVVSSWGSWSSWSQCTKTCGSGSRFRTRKCYGRARCYGLSYQSVSCNGQRCPGMVIHASFYWFIYLFYL